jgi:hypothetical protein
VGSDALTASAWGKAWGRAWGSSWGRTQADAGTSSGGSVYRLPPGLDNPPPPSVETEAWDEVDDIGLIVSVASMRRR